MLGSIEPVPPPSTLPTDPDTTNMNMDMDMNMNINSEMDLDPIRNDLEIHNLISDCTPINSRKKRKLTTDQLKPDIEEEESLEKSTKKSSINSASPNIQNGPNYKNDMKKLLQLPDSEISKYYQIKSNNKLVLTQGQTGEAPYRYHPDTIGELNEYFGDMKSIQIDSSGLAAYVKLKYSRLLAKLTQDSQVPQVDLHASLRTILCPIAGNIPEYPIDGKLLDGIVEKVSYGHPGAGNNFSAWSCTFWQVKDLELLGPEIGKHFLTNYVLRSAARMILENSLESVSNEVPSSTLATEPVSVINVDELPMNLMKIESGLATPKKREKERKEKASVALSAVNSTTSNNTPQSTIPKISSFFAKLKKSEVIEKGSGEYFQPFFVKPDVTLAPINQLKELKSSLSLNSQEIPNEYWTHFRSQCVNVRYKRQSCLCVGYDGKPIRATLKLFKFEENYRPAYLGTWRKVAPPGTVSPRSPFGRLPDIDYEYDSDAEWDEGEDPEGESLSDLDDDDEEDEDDLDEDLEDVSNQSCTESVDSWLVPHGYLSDDEGVDEVHPGELEEAQREAELLPPPPPQPQQKKSKRKFIPKEPLLLGPFLSDQSVPQILRSNTLQFISSSSLSNSYSSPFSNFETVFAALESSLSGGTKKSSISPQIASENEKSERTGFPESLLSSLIQIININSSAGITKLYDEFVLQHGKVVSRRLFESKLNQITIGKLKCPRSGKLRWTFKDEIGANDGNLSKLTIPNSSIENYFPSNPMEIN